MTYVAAVSRPADACNAGWTSAVGRIDGLLPAVLHDAGVDPGASIAFVCGNPAMAEAVTRALTSFGLALHRRSHGGLLASDALGLRDRLAGPTPRRRGIEARREPERRSHERHQRHERARSDEGERGINVEQGPGNPQ